MPALLLQWDNSFCSPFWVLQNSSLQLFKWRWAHHFFSGDYNDDIREAVAQHDFEAVSTLIAHDVAVKGTQYKKTKQNKNMSIVISDDD